MEDKLVYGKIVVPILEVIENIERFEDLRKKCEEEIIKDCKKIEEYNKNIVEIKKSGEEGLDAYTRAEKAYKSLEYVLTEMKNEYNALEIYNDDMQKKYDDEYKKIIIGEK
jgi:hypothetical protein